MRKLLFFMSISFFFQICVGQTTMTEYNYLTKGYKLDLETGRDIKNGYRISLACPTITQKLNGAERSITIYKFILLEEERTVALLVKLGRTDTNYIGYYCLPDNKSDIEVLEKATKDFFDDNQKLNDLEFAKTHYLWLSLNSLKYAFLK
ncbi:hypothetical protein [Winogradskyella sp. SYSU M77433]|uniref:hypothetical protein n=1 Tax=Winogradskyella sp. SYSU M77433 TaxID=3042722 RepID=UPI002480386D|nr:hypothetical protein [Winogradskyella sp. SYSU M77433]MDH7912554.1 hypothetical protein [Winogradskyella sp. SYSU M77433]